MSYLWKPGEIEEAIANLSSTDPERRSSGATTAYNAVQQGADISSLVPALSTATGLSAPGSWVSTFGPRALKQAALNGADLTPALPGLLEKLSRENDQDAADALCAWASRSSSNAHALLKPLEALTNPRAVQLLADARILAKATPSEQELRWSFQEKPVSVALQAGRLVWRGKFQREHEQSISDFVNHGVDQRWMAYVLGTWDVPPEVMTRVRGWLGFKPEAESAQQRDRRRLEELFAALNCTESKGPCEACARLGSSRSCEPLAHESLAPWSSHLKLELRITSKGTSSPLLYRCPACATLYLREYEHECEPFEPETDRETLVRIAATDALPLLLRRTFEYPASEVESASL